MFARYRFIDDVVMSRDTNLTYFSELRMDNKLLLVIIAIILPPVAVFLNNGAGKDLIVSILLTIFFFLPGLIHALWLILR